MPFGINDLEDTVAGVEGQDTVKASSDDELKRQFTQTNDKLQQSQFMLQLMKDPEIGEILRARAENRKVKIIPLSQVGDEETDPAATMTQPQQPPNFDEMNEQQKMDYMVGQIGKQTNTSVNKMLEKTLSPLMQRLQQLEGLAQQHENNAAIEQVKLMRQRYDDFDEYKTQMLGLSDANPNLNAEQLYVLAKTSAGKPIVTNTRVASERPNNTTALPPQNLRKKPLPPGTLGLRQAIQGAAGRLRERMGSVDGLIDDSTDME